MYEVVIGLEVHAQISSKSKLFCRCDNDSFGKEPNTTVCPVCMGFPGMLPTLNGGALHKALRTALSLQCSIPPFSAFDRKNYFYPDLPKGYQISQYHHPLAVKGYLDTEIEGEIKKIRINRLHIEDDAGKLVHQGDFSFVDFNRAGSPLMEIVTEPDLRSPREARLFAEELQRVLKYSDSSDADMYKGMMRFDASISLRPQGEEKLYPRTEIKNLNSFKALEAALEYEVKRQERLWQDGTPQNQATTVGWQEEHGKTFFMRNKEGESDYRYFPEPDLPPLCLSHEYIAEIQKEIPELPLLRRNRFVQSYELSEGEAMTLTSDRALADFFEDTVAQTKDPKKVASFLLTILLKHIKQDSHSMRESPVSAHALAELIHLINEGAISGNTGKEVLSEMYKTGKSAKDIVEEKGLKQMSDSGELETICQEVMSANPKIVADVRGGKDKAIGALVGQVMGKTRGQANPQMVNEILKRLIGA